MALRQQQASAHTHDMRFICSQEEIARPLHNHTRSSCSHKNKKPMTPALCALTAVTGTLAWPLRS